MKYIVLFVSLPPALLPTPGCSKTTAGYKGQGGDATPGRFFVISIGLKKGKQITWCPVRPEIFWPGIGGGNSQK